MNNNSAILPSIYVDEAQTASARSDNGLTLLDTTRTLDQTVGVAQVQRKIYSGVDFLNMN